MQTIGVAYGYGGRDELTKAGATHVVASPGEIAGLIG